jgi:hypothetical protein
MYVIIISENIFSFEINYYICRIYLLVFTSLYCKAAVIIIVGLLTINLIKMGIEKKDVKVKMSVCPECRNSIRVAVEHTMTTKSKNEFAKEVMKHDLQVKTISLDEYRSSNIQLYCKESCSMK